MADEQTGDEFDPEDVKKAEAQAREVYTHNDDEARGLLNRRKVAYAGVFSVGKTSQADLDIVLNDIAKFCREYEPSYNPMDGVHADTLAKMKEGRREVYSRIIDHTKLDTDVLLMKYHNVNF